MTSKFSNTSVIRCLYRSLLKVTKPLNLHNNNAVIFSCLLHRTGVEDEDWSSFLRKISFDNKDHFDTDHEEDEDDSIITKEDGEKSDSRQHQQSITLFRELVREIITGDTDGIRQMQFPSHVVEFSSKSNPFHDMIRREFRMITYDDISVASSYNANVRREVAFMALREINKKLAWINQLENNLSKRVEHPNQAALHVKPLPLRPPSAYLRPGTFLISHPHMTGYFRRTVICILDHKEEDDVDIMLSSRPKPPSSSSSSTEYGSYGLIVNRSCVSPHSGKNLTLDEILRPIPPKLLTAFGNTLVKEGGPVHMSLQMVRSSNSQMQDDSSLEIGGTFIQPEDVVIGNKSAADSLSTFYNGDVFKAADAVASGQLDPHDVSFFVGATCWSVGQLESEIERGFWLPCSGPLNIAQSGICHHQQSSNTTTSSSTSSPSTNILNGNDRPRTDLWLSMLSACGSDEAKLAHLLADDDGKNEFGQACDGFD